MAKIYTFVADEFPVALTLKNPAKGADNEATAWNTGLAAAGEPHFGEKYAGVALDPEVAVYTDITNRPEIFEKTFELRMWRTNQFITLKPGDEVVINARNSAELAYYLGIPDSDIFEIVERDTYVQDKTVTLPEVREGADAVTATVNFTPDADSKYVWTVNGEVIEETETAKLEGEDLFVKDDILAVTIEGVTAETTVLEAST